MLKKMLAITLAAVMAIMPMTASAVTWGEVVTSLNTKGYYDNDEDEVYAEAYDEYVDVWGNGTITGDGDKNVIVIKPDTVNGGYDYWFSGVKLSADQIKIETNDQSMVVALSDGVIVDGDVVSDAKGDETWIEVYNWGTINGDMDATASGKETFADNYNYGVVGGDMNSTTAGESSNNWNENYGEVGGDMNATATGKDSYIYNYVSGGTVGGSVSAEANAEGAVAENSVYDGYDDETGKKIPVDVSNVTATASNGGVVTNMVDTELDSLTAVIGEGGTVIAGTVVFEEDEETGKWNAVTETIPDAVKAKNVTIVIEAGAEDTYTAEQIKAMIKATGMTPTETIYYTVNADGERTAEYSIGADGSLTFVRKLIEEYTAEELEWIKKQDKIARENHERELKRHAEAIGGVTASPEWVKQLFLGYMSLNLRMYEEGEQILFREKLAWAGDGTKNLTLRVNIDEPQALTVRLDEVVLDKLEQAEISLITLLAKDSTPVMQYKVSDLRGAYTQYGLAGADLLVVGGADDEVMKIGADGEMKPVEAE